MLCKVKRGSIHYEVIGEGMPLIILHSMGTDHRSMKAWLEPIFKNKRGYQRVYVDLPAHGHSEIDSTVKSTDDILSNVLEFIDIVFSNNEFALLGASYGGYLAQGIVHIKRKHVKKIVLLAPAIHHLKERIVPEKVLLEKNHSILNALDVDTRVAFETLMIYQNEENLKCFLEEVQPGRLLANRKFLTSDWREKGYFLSQEPFSDVSCLPQEVLLILGKQDHICGYQDYQFMLDKFPHSNRVILDLAGHMLHIEQRRTVQQLVGDWLYSTKETIGENHGYSRDYQQIKQRK
ncbi:alpha/beta fold hydrolase [Fictibacillus sp. 18YEL24]|uniref:alpha/beta fold hydrolase n=1 Tax=Fictibacillus sp. 18YEL24 TaxID=2745875 RepID=UPI0018CF134D|nr:alpha/beta hydrolase [Fictibacillus sp. 18YEL24]MBH0168235.1 alpha/beta hydrolase [Fictibacillus sp. 18YEL24]